ncbi:MAG: hypothetical protein ACR2P5_08950 [Gammaproteobacteria bacterium]
MARRFARFGRRFWRAAAGENCGNGAAAWYTAEFCGVIYAGEIKRGR